MYRKFSDTQSVDQKVEYCGWEEVRTWSSHASIMAFACLLHPSQWWCWWWWLQLLKWWWQWVLPIQRCQNQRELRTTPQTCCKRGFAPVDPYVTELYFYHHCHCRRPTMYDFLSHHYNHHSHQESSLSSSTSVILIPAIKIKRMAIWSKWFHQKNLRRLIFLAAEIVLLSGHMATT